MSACAMIESDRTHRGCGGFGNFLCELLELSIQHLTTFPLLLFELNFVLVAVTILALPISCLVELNVRSFTEELYILR